jgi:hypothetical protein
VKFSPQKQSCNNGDDDGNPRAGDDDGVDRNNDGNNNAEKRWNGSIIKSLEMEKL